MSRLDITQLAVALARTLEPVRPSDVVLYRDVQRLMCGLGASRIFVFRQGSDPEIVVGGGSSIAEQDLVRTSSDDAAIITQDISQNKDWDVLNYMRIPLEGGRQIKGILAALHIRDNSSGSIASVSLPRGVNYVFIEYSENNDVLGSLFVNSDFDEDRFLIYNEELHLYCYHILLLLTIRRRSFENFPSRIVSLYWNRVVAFEHCMVDQLGYVGATRESQLVPCPPWMSPSRHTITLSLDLRRSTFGMEMASHPGKYSRWIEALILILRQISHSYLGVVDKFTGDGLLVHFLAEECSVIDNELSGTLIGEAELHGARAAEMAVRCACDMIVATEFHMRQLNRILRLRNIKMGPAVGLAADQGRWSVDRDGNLIVVGFGVVQACRAAAGTLAGRVRMTPITAELVQERFDLERHIRWVPFESKEFAKDSGVVIAEIDSHVPGLTRSVSELIRLCNNIYEAIVDGAEVSDR